MNTRPAAPEPLRRAIERIEQLRAIDPVASWARRRSAPLADGRTGDVLKGQWLGHALHPLLTDLPLGCWLGSAVLDVAGGKRSRHASTRLIATGLALVPVTAAAGIADWSTVRDKREERVGIVHGVGNVVVTLLYVRSWRRRHQGRHLTGMMWGLAGGGLALATGYLGGHLSFNLGTGVGDRGIREQPTTHVPIQQAQTGSPTPSADGHRKPVAVPDGGPVESWEGLD
ncbi:MAG: DUF2231 domain-containing protein [Ilumatobacteraceae bacterium]